MNVVASIPKHLHKYIVEQNYDRYTFEDQEVWRFVMRQLKSFLSEHAHSAYVSGLKQTGITINEIPKIDVMDEKLKEFGWRAVAVSGFIPPAAFMEFQSNGILPIACDMRTIDHILYTPAPDIVHEAAGHAPILVDSEFSQYLKNYAEVASKSIISSEDLNLYEAIRSLSDIKEAPQSTKAEIEKAEAELQKAIEKMTYVSEAQLLGRMNWWTAEYGLIGDLKAPKIFGAGLLSSIGESRMALKKPKLMPLTTECLDFSYDITEQQPQLFVAEDFKSLNLVLKELASQLAFNKGGPEGLSKAKQAKTVCTVILESENTQKKLSFSGILLNYKFKNEQIQQLEFIGPVQILKDKELSLNESKTIIFNFENIAHSTLNDVQTNSSVINLSIGDNFKVISVHGGPIDSARFPDSEDFVAARVPEKKRSTYDLKKFEVYKNLRQIRSSFDLAKFDSIKSAFLTELSSEWLIGLGLIEIASEQKQKDPKFEKHICEIMNHFSLFKSDSQDHKLCIDLGLNSLKAEGHLS